jgi:hypothetical protein
MYKKLSVACMATVALVAFVVAPAASASPVLTNVAGAAVVGTEITAKNTGNAVFTGPFNVTCSSADLQGKVTANSGTQFKAEVPAGSALFTGTGSFLDCTSSLGSADVFVDSAICLETVKGTDKVAIDGCALIGGIRLGLMFTLTVTGTGPCRYTTSFVNGTFVTSAGATVNVSEQVAKLSEGGFFCPKEGKLDMDFDIYGPTGNLMTIS